MPLNLPFLRAVLHTYYWIFFRNKDGKRKTEIYTISDEDATTEIGIISGFPQCLGKTPLYGVLPNCHRVRWPLS